MLEIWRELRFGLRVLLRKPLFAAAVLLSLALGIGTNSAIFTLLNRIFFNPIPVEKVDELVVIYQSLRDEKGEYVGRRSLAYPNFVDYREHSRTFQDMVIHQWGMINLTSGEEPQRITGSYASANFFDLLGVRPADGRFFLPGEGEFGGDPVAVLSDACWRRLFAARPDMVGQVIELNDFSFTVIGIAPPGFKGAMVDVSVDVFVPITFFKQLSPFASYFELRDVGLFNAFGRLAPGVTLEQAEDDLRTLSLNLSEEHLREGDSMAIVLRPFVEGTFAQQDRDLYEKFGFVLGLAVQVILWISCFNVLNLLLVRSRERQRELATRLAVGCSRKRLILQLLVENLGLFLLGGLLSLVMARLSLELIWKYRPPQVNADVLSLGLDANALLFTFGVALVTGLLIGVLPAFPASKPDLVTSLKEGRQTNGGHRSFWLRPQNLLVVAQVALALVALIGAGLALRSLNEARQLDLGFHYERMASLSFAPGEQGYEEPQARDLYQRILERTRALPGVESATLASNRLLRGSITQRQVFYEGQLEAATLNGRAFHRVNVVVPGFFETTGIELVKGRDFDATILADGPPVAIINETMARQGWPDQDPIGKRFSFDYPDRERIEVIGVVRDAVYRDIHDPPQLFLYLPLEQAFASGMTLHVRTAGDPAAMLPTLRREIRQLDSHLVLADVQPMTFFVENAFWREDVLADLLSIFGFLALFLAIVGVYGVLAYSVTQKQHELAMRMALGAQKKHVRRVVLGEALALIGVGWVVGLVLSLIFLPRYLTEYLMGVSAFDPVTYTVMSVILAALALLGAAVPMWRAMRIHPMRLLRGE